MSNPYYRGIDPSTLSVNTRKAILQYMGQQKGEQDNDQFLYWVNNWRWHNIIEKIKADLDMEFPADA